MIRRVSTDMIKVEGHTHRFNLYFDKVNPLSGRRHYGQRPVVLHRGKLIPMPDWYKDRR